MKRSNREAMIDAITASAPKGFGLSARTRANLEKMDDDTLKALHGKLKTVEAFAAKSALTRKHSDPKRARLAQSRKVRYERLASLSAYTEAAQPNVGDPVAIDPVVRVPGREHSELVPFDTALFEPVVHAGSGPSVELSEAVRLWNTFDKAHQGYADILRPALTKWVVHLSVVLGRPQLSEAVLQALRGPLRSDIDHYLELASDRIGRDALRLVRNHVMHQTGLVSLAGWDERVHALISDLTREALEPDFLIAPVGRIRETVAIDGLAKMRSFALNYKPDVVISVSPGGKIVGDFVAAEMKRANAGVVVVEYKHRNRGITGGWRALRSRQRVLLVDDIAGSTDFLCNAHERLTAQLETSDIQLVALASTFETRDQIIQEGHANIFVAHLAESQIDVPWDRSGDYRFSTKNHVFGDGRDKPLTVSKAQIRRVSESLAEPVQVAVPSPA